MEMLITTYSPTDVVICMFFIDWLKTLKIKNLRVSEKVLRDKLDYISETIYQKYSVKEGDKFVEAKYRHDLISRSIGQA